MTNNPQQLVQKLWNYCSILRDDGLSYGDYVEQLTFLLFLKMADEQSRPPFRKPSTVPNGYDWPSLLTKDGVPLDGTAPGRCFLSSFWKPRVSVTDNFVKSMR
jgi:type I restriction enzyme M protein